jgi:hypothetical protein
MKRGAKEGFGFGVVAGIIFAVAEVIIAAMMDNPALMPFRMFASIVFGQEALGVTPIGTAVAVGIVVHLILSALFGLVYGVVNSRFSLRTQADSSTQLGIGLAFGVALWFVNFQIIARTAYPWFLDAPQGLQAILHAVAFGLPLGIMYGAAERRARHLGPPATQP